MFRSYLRRGTYVTGMTLDPKDSDLMILTDLIVHLVNCMGVKDESGRALIIVATYILNVYRYTVRCEEMYTTHNT